MTTPPTAQPEGQSSHPQAATLEFRNVSKTYDGVGGARDPGSELRGPRRRDLRPRGPLGLRQDDGHAPRQPHDRDDQRRHPARRRARCARAVRPTCAARSATRSSRSASSPTRRSPRTSPPCRGCWAGRASASAPASTSSSSSSGSIRPSTRDRYPAQLSGGQRQRVGVARALAADPPLMLMDEPFGAIDPINRERLQDELLRLQERIRKTIVFVTHDIDEAIRLGDRIAVLKKGGVLAQYATPGGAADGARPTTFVEDFVGADRALKRLALTSRRRGRPAAGRQRAALRPRPRRGRAPGRVGARRRAPPGAHGAQRRVPARRAERPAAQPGPARRGRRRRGARGGRARPRRHPRAARARGRGDERADDPRAVGRRLLPRPLADHRQLRGQQRLLPGLDRPPPRPLRVALLAAPVPRAWCPSASAS